MDKSAVFNHYANMLDTLLEDTLFFQYYFQNTFCMDEDIEHPCFNLDWYVHFGATRVCLEDRAYDYVVKMDLSTYDEGACEKEESIFASACAEHLDRYFIEPIYIGTYNRTIRFYDAYDIETYMDDFYYYDEEEFSNKFADNEDKFGELHEILISLPLYAYRRAHPYKFEGLYRSLGSDKPETEVEKFARNSKSPLQERNLAIALAFINEYGRDEFVKLSDFLEVWDVNDLHSNNIADIDGRPVILDFAGFAQSY